MAYIAETSVVTETRHTLELLRQHVMKNLGASVADSINIRHTDAIHYGLKGMVLELEASLLASRIAEDKYKAHFYWKEPSSWFQHWKQDKAPKWFKRRYPVRYDKKKATRTVKFTRFETYPKANIAIPKDQRTIEILGFERPLFDRIEEY